MSRGDWDEGGVSDESDFYGDTETQADLEKQVGRVMKRGYDDTFAEVYAKRVKFTQNPTLSPNKEVTQRVSLIPEPKVQSTSQNASSTSLRQTQTLSVRKPVNNETATANIEADDRFKHDPSAWQRSETIDDFLKRAPVEEESTADLGPWLWVGNPKPISSHIKLERATDLPAFTDAGEQLLEAYTSQRAEIEAANAGKAAGTITRYMRPYREQLEDDLLDLAVKTTTVCGKWLLFPHSNDLARTWCSIAQAMVEGKLGPMAKVATFDAASPRSERVVCVYTYDFTDHGDVRRVLDALVGIEVCRRDGSPIYYKCDAYTYLHLMSDNPYKIKATLYSSKEMLDAEGRTTGGGPIVRWQRRNSMLGVVAEL